MGIYGSPALLPHHNLISHIGYWGQNRGIPVINGDTKKQLKPENENHEE